MSQSLRWGIVGTSFISGVMADAIRLEGRSEITAVAGRNEERLIEFANQHQIAGRYTDYEALIRSDEVDIVYIALPNHLHTDYVIMAANAGKAIVCEKSLSVDVVSAKAALAAVEQAQVFFAEGLMYLNHPLVAELLNQLDSGVIGELKSVQASYSAAISQFTNPGSKGALFNLGCYPLSLLHRVLSHLNVTTKALPELTGFGRIGEDGNVVESNVALQFDCGVVAQLHTAEDYGLKHQFELLGSKGYLRCDSNPWLPAANNRFVVAEYEQPERVVEVDAQGDAFLYQVRHVIDALEGGEIELCYPAANRDDSMAIMKMLCHWHERVETE